MEDFTILSSQTYQNVNIQAALSAQLKKLREQYPERFSKPVYVLPDVDNSEHGQWEQRLLEVAQKQSGERTVLIPYSYKNSHWIGVLLKFEADEKVERAEFIDPVQGSSFLPDKLQKEFAIVYPNVILRPRYFQKQCDQQQSATLIVENLLKAVEEPQCTGARCDDTKYSHNDIFCDLKTTTNFDEEEQRQWKSEGQSVRTSAPFAGNISKPHYSTQPWSSEFETVKKQEASKSPLKASRIEQETQQYEMVNRQLENGLAKHDIESKEELSQQIIKKKQEIQTLENEKRHNLARKRKDSLSNLEQLQVLVDEVETLKPSPSNDNYEMWKKRLESGLAEHDIESKEELLQQIIIKKQEIQRLKNEEKHNLVRRRKDSLSELEQLLVLVDQMEGVKPSYLNVVNRKSEQVLINDQPDYDIQKQLRREEVRGIDDLQEECLVTRESLMSLYQDFQKMPTSSEKSTIRLLYYISCKLADNSTFSDHSISIPNRIEVDVEKELECLKERLQIEELQSADIQNMVETSFINVKKKYWKPALIILRKLLKHISPLDLQELFRLIDKVNDTAVLVNKKDIILFLGGTGSGKSTTIHFLAGSKMVRKIVNGMNHIAPVEIKNPDLKNITTSPFSRSETRCITSVTVNFQDVCDFKSGSIILCDSPGFEDTAGAEVDIANGIGIVEAIKGCESVKPVVLISYKSIGDRFEGLKDLTHILAGLIPGIKDHIEAFSYIFTKYPQNERDTIYASLVDVRKKMNDTEKGTSFVNFFDDMLHKTKKHPQVIDPVNDDPGKLLNALAKSAFISNPAEVFQFSITEKSKTVVQEQVRKHQFSIMSATKRYDYLFVNYKLGQLKRLNDLLSLDFIKQIYNECIRYISKHLAEEYEEGISMLNRCLMNQTVLSNEDVKQYQTRIDHAKIAEEIRNNHLGKDVVHSSAFVQYLSQQVDTMLEDLRTKDIGDLSVKNNLDKIKLLSNSFPDIDSKYKEVCQFLFQNFDSVADSFKSSVLSNTFEKSASDINKFYEVLTNLRDHLKHKNMETKYIQLKEYFLKYLSDSVAKINHILSQEKLEQNDIDNLNSCACMLENATNTFALQPHIAKESINGIYEEFLSKTLNYFEQIIKKIDVQLENENSFLESEQLVNEMDLMRTISIIKFKTCSSYFRTLERLCGYIQQLRRDVEAILSDLVRGEMQVNYNKLTKCLSALKHTKWIEKYRTGIYANVMDSIEEHLVEHIEYMKKCVMDINLDLDNFDKIDYAYKIVSKINEIKRVGKIFTAIGSLVDEVNIWFENVTNKVFNMIKDIYSVEKEQAYQTLDFNKIEKAFNYLDACKKVSALFKSDCTPVLNDLENFIKDFSIFIQKKMEEYFEIIKQYENENQKDMFVKARMLSNHLGELSEIKTTQSRIFSCFSKPKIVEEWKSELSSYLIELSNEMDGLRATQRTDVLNTKLVIVKALSRLDSFLEGEKYIAIYQKYQKIFSSQTSDAHVQVMKAFEQADYQRVAYEMVALHSSNEVGQHFFQQAKRMLRTSFDILMSKVKDDAMLGESIEVVDIKNIVDTLKQIQRAKQSLSTYLDTPEEIDECVEEVNKTIGDRIKRSLESFKAFINMYNFYEADQKITSIRMVRNLLEKCCGKEVLDHIEALKTIRDEVVLNVVDKYSKMDIVEYASNSPKEILQKLERVKDTDPLYSDAFNSINKSIIDTFEKEFVKAKAKMMSDAENLHLEKIKIALQYLPETIKETCELKVRICKEDIGKLIFENNNKLDNVFDSRDLKNIKIVLQEYQKSEDMRFYLNKGRERVLGEMQQVFLKINENFDQNNISEALLNVKIIYEYKIMLENIVDDLQPLYLEVQARVRSIFDVAYLCVTNRFLSANLLTITDEIIDVVEKNFLCLMEFMKVGDDLKNQPILTDIFPEHFNENIKTLNEKLSCSINGHQKNYEVALQKLDTVILKNTLCITCKWDSLFKKIETYDNIYSSNETSVNTIVQIIKGLTPYSDMLKSISFKIEELRDELMNSELINDDTKGFSKRRNEFYGELNEKYSILNDFNQFSSFNISINVNKIAEDCLESLERKLMEISSVAETLLERFLQDSKLTKLDYDRFNLYCSNLISFRQEMKLTYYKINKKIEEIDLRFFDKIQSWDCSAESDPSVQGIANGLINMKRVSNHIPLFKVRINEKIDEALYHHKSTTKDTTTFVKIAAFLNQDKTGVGQSIISEHKLFQGYSLSLFNERTRKHDINYVLENLKGDYLDKVLLRKRYDKFNTCYQNLIKKYLTPNMELNTLIADTKFLAGDTKQEQHAIAWDSIIRNKVPDLMAHVFALWTLRNADHYFEAVHLDDKNNYLFQPHAAQVISIFRMLSIGDKKEELRNNLVQIGTGEGKSVILGATACILILLGFDVCCVCYSEYLNQRDYNSFLPLFDSLGLLSYIHYGTFNKLCEDIINGNYNIRQTVEQLISTGTNNAIQNKRLNKRAKILLIDEVDVFFSQDFYGNVYIPSASLRGPTISSLVDFIWKERKSKLNLNIVKSTEEYRACCDRFPNWEELIEEAIKDMFFDVNNFESHGYVVSQDKIGYKEQDNIVYNVVYGYKTLFAYLCEYEKGVISKESLDENISIKIKCGSFLYADIPLEFKYIMGATGTLKTLSDPEKKVIENEYRIKKYTYTPSVFGQNNLKFTEKDDIMIENDDDYFNVIRREIDDRLKGKSSEKRAVLVLFESKKELKEFYESKALESIKEWVSYLTEEASLEEKENLIKRATASGQITLLTRSFGRGTDFICHDQSVVENGGIHVIQTFLSKEVSEELQIKGRTARHGDQGSYSMVLLDRDLERFHIEKQHIDDLKKGRDISAFFIAMLHMGRPYKTVYDLLNGKRIELFKTQYEANTLYVKEAHERHENARKFLSSLESNDINSISQFLIEENKGVEGISGSRTVFLMDATCSMIHLLQKCKNTVETMFKRVSEVLEDNNINSDSFQIQFVVYRNYNSRYDKILQSSPWETKPDSLRAFINSIDVEGGWNNEAIEIGLWHANKENEKENITQVILIGDAPPNTMEEVKQKREHFGETYWKKTKFAKPTDHKVELATLISNHIPVHAFFIEQRAQEKFTEIAHETGGRCELLDINSTSGSKMLTDLVTEEILRNVGGTTKGDALVEAYRTKFARSYT